VQPNSIYLNMYSNIECKLLSRRETTGLFDSITPNQHTVKNTQRTSAPASIDKPAASL